MSVDAVAEWSSVVSHLAQLSARERQQLIDEFVDRTFAGIPADAPGAGIAAAMRVLPPELPPEPTGEETAAWLELGELVQDPAFATRVRQVAVAGAATDQGDLPQVDTQQLLTLGRRALHDGRSSRQPARSGARCRRPGRSRE